MDKENGQRLLLNIHPKTLNNADETGLCFRAMPEHTYLFKNESAKGFKSSNEQVTVLCCANMKSEKRDLLVTGKSKNPPCFKGVRSLPVDYYSNAIAWMIRVIFND